MNNFKERVTRIASIFLYVSMLASCASIKKESPAVGLQPATPIEKKQVKEIFLSSEEILALFQELKKQYESKKGESNYISALNEFADKYHYWNAKGLIDIEKGYSLYERASNNLDSPSEAADFFRQSQVMFKFGFEDIDSSNIENKDIVYPEIMRLIDNMTYCRARYGYISNKVESSDTDFQKRNYLKEYSDLFNDDSCPLFVKAWAVNNSISRNTDNAEFSKRVVEAYQYINKSRNAEEIIYLTNSLAWAEFSLGNYEKSLELFNKFSAKEIRENEKYIYDSDGMISSNDRYKELVKNAIERKNCKAYWDDANPESLIEKSIIDIVQSYNELHDLANKGRRETTPVYETLSYSKEKIVVDYNVSPLLFKVQSASERLLAKINVLDKDKYSSFFSNIRESVVFMQKSVDFRIKGYYLKKKDYRGEWEKADAFMDESRGLYSEALRSATAAINGKKYSSCVVDDWNGYLKAVSEMRM
jgi:hypothetical protein